MLITDLVIYVFLTNLNMMIYLFLNRTINNQTNDQRVKSVDLASKDALNLFIVCETL